MAVKLTIKQENFCLAYLETGNASEAYRIAFNANKMKSETINRNAKTLIDDSKITARLTELRKPIMKRHNITIDSLIDELEDARLAALKAETAQASAAVSATMSKAKLLGMDKQIIEHTSPDGTMTPSPAVVISGKEVKEVLSKLNDEC